MNLVQRSDLPAECAKRLGTTNGTIVFNLVTDVIQNSSGNPYTAFSPEVSEALKELKNFNLERIYLNPKIKKHTQAIQKLFKMLFEKYLDDIEQNNPSSAIFNQFLDGMSEEYLKGHNHAEIVRDFISGMTDQYFLSQFPESLRPQVQRM
jgi:dGTPase